MKTSLHVTMVSLLLTSVTAAPVLADDHMRAQPVELYACTFKEGKGMKDLDKANANFQKWATANTSGHSAWMITPQFRSAESEFHVGWIGGYQSAEDFGASMDKWVNASGSVSQTYSDTLDCTHALMASYTVGAPQDPPEDGLVWFSRCSLEDDASFADAAASHAKVTAMMREMGAKGSSWILVPGLGSGDAEFDYYQVSAWPSYPVFASAWEIFINGGGMAKSNALQDGVTRCESPNMYDAKLILAPPAAD